jgi:uncharacterized protein (DUF1697 family)
LPKYSAPHLSSSYQLSGVALWHNISTKRGTVSQVNTIIALFRGINVGGKFTLPMRDLVVLFEDLGCRNIRTYIQSGNVIFDTISEPCEELSKRISEKVDAKFGFKPYVLMLSMQELAQAITHNPFAQTVDNPQSLHLGFLASEPVSLDVVRLEKLKSQSERFQLIGKVFYLFAPDGVGRSKLASGAEHVLGVPMTDRNWRTVCKIMEMAQKENPS